MSDCVFCKIIAGELPSWKVYETDTVLAFMDIGPVVKGHTLVIPKAHHENVTTLPDDQLAAAMAVARCAAGDSNRSSYDDASEDFDEWAFA